jgi:hypothetical protein
MLTVKSRISCTMHRENPLSCTCNSITKINILIPVKSHTFYMKSNFKSIYLRKMISGLNKSTLHPFKVNVYCIQFLGYNL